METSDTIVVSLLVNQTKLSREVVVPALRHWTVYIYPHSHVDIGYTNTQENVEFIHKRNLDVAMDLIEQTASYPEDARFVWNLEVTWPVERYLATEPKEKRERLLKFIRNGSVAIDAGYISTNTSAANEEELLQLFRYGKKLEKETGQAVKTMVQVDVPGVSWGIVPSLNQLGISYCLSLYNGIGRIGLASQFEYRPFWWVGPDKKSKVLFLQTASYNPGALYKGFSYAMEIMGQTDRSKLTPFIKTDNPRANFIDPYLELQLPMLEKRKDYPYDIFPMSWSMADNTPIDVDLPDAVKSWNEEYAYPHLKICTGTEMMEAFDKKYGDIRPIKEGDYTEYWTDGLGTAAQKTGESREAKEKLVQGEILWSMLNPGKEAPDQLIDEAWRNILLSTEHTWMFSDPYKEPISGEILKVKFGYFDQGRDLSEQALEQAYDKIQDTASDQFTIFNTNTWAQTGVVYLSADQSGDNNTVVDAEGNEVLSQRLYSGELAFLASDVPALGYKLYHLKKEAGKGSKANLDGVTRLDNGKVSVQVDPQSGDVVSLMLDGVEYVDSQSSSAINSYRYLHADDTPGRATKAFNCRVKCKESGPLVYSILVKSEAEGCNSLEREVRLVKGSSVVELVNVVDKQAIVDKEGVHFGFAFDVPGGVTKFNIPWGIMELEKDQLQAANRNWVAMQRWLDVSNKDKGITWCSLNACMFECGDLTANIMYDGMSVPWLKKIQPSTTFYSWALNNHWYTNYPLSQEGKIRFKYRLAPHNKAYNVVEATRFGLEQFRPLIVVQTKDKIKQLNAFSVGDDEIFLSTFKTVDKGRSAIIRLYSVSDVDKSVSIAWKGKHPQKCYYVEDDKRIAADYAKIRIPSKGVVSLLVEW
ncbi:MAG: glycosyl hydrolase [Parabacteroides gordonii]|nr:glycosyl hydrolase [Parabacteroides gordonii]